MSKSDPGEFVLLGMPDVNGSLRGKALSRDAFEAAVRDGTVTTDLLLGLDPVDHAGRHGHRVARQLGGSRLPALGRTDPAIMRFEAQRFSTT